VLHPCATRDKNHAYHRAAPRMKQNMLSPKYGQDQVTGVSARINLYLYRRAPEENLRPFQELVLTISFSIARVSQFQSKK
jgi:hypothetical protein